MSDVKEVKVSLMPQDEKKLTRTTTRKRRTKGGATAKLTGAEVAAGASDPNVFVRTDLAPVPSPTDALDTRGHGWLPTANASQIQPTVEKQVTAAPGPTAADVGVNVGPPMRGGTVNTVRFTAKKRNGTTNTVPGAGAAAASAHTPRILPTKRKSGGSPAMIATRKKEKLIIPPTPSVGGAKNATPVPASTSRTRKFKERRISITVKPGARNAAKRMREKIAAMPISGVRRTLLRRGVLKPGGKPLPEGMMRAMLRDYMLLHNRD